MTVFEYLSVLLSVVMGLGLTHILVGFSKSVHHRDTLKVYWVHVAWGVNVIVYIVGIWWGMFWWSGLPEWTFVEFLLVFAYTVSLFLLASILYPWDIPPDFDFEDHFYRNRSWFFGLLTVAWFIDIPETVLKAEGGLRGLPPSYWGFVAVIILSAVIAALTGNRRFHAAFAVFWFLWVTSYLTLTTLGQIAG
ncbi:MAG: hypothetical protein ABFS34_16190 [Gemmatimonadota bacterium]